VTLVGSPRDDGRQRQYHFVDMLVFVATQKFFYTDCRREFYTKWLFQFLLEPWCVDSRSRVNISLVSVCDQIMVAYTNACACDQIMVACTPTRNPTLKMYQSCMLSHISLRYSIKLVYQRQKIQIYAIFIDLLFDFRDIWALLWYSSYDSLRECAWDQIVVACTGARGEKLSRDIYPTGPKT